MIEDINIVVSLISKLVNFFVLSVEDLGNFIMNLIIVIILLLIGLNINLLI